MSPKQVIEIRELIEDVLSEFDGDYVVYQADYDDDEIWFEVVDEILDQHAFAIELGDKQVTIDGSLDSEELELLNDSEMMDIYQKFAALLEQARALQEAGEHQKAMELLDGLQDIGPTDIPRRIYDVAERTTKPRLRKHCRQSMRRYEQLRDKHGPLGLIPFIKYADDLTEIEEAYEDEDDEDYEDEGGRWDGYDEDERY